MLMINVSRFIFFFFFNDTATTEIYTLSLHDALPTSTCSPRARSRRSRASWPGTTTRASSTRSEEHTSELQSPCNLVCRLLLEKKKQYSLSPLLSYATTKSEVTHCCYLLTYICTLHSC